MQALIYSFPDLEPVCSLSSSNCCYLTCIHFSQEAGQVVWYSHLFKNFPAYCDPHSQRLWCSQWSRSRLTKSKNSCFFDDPVDVGSLISRSSAFSKSSLDIWKFNVLLKPGLENFEHYFASVWDECNCAVVWAFFGIAFLWDWNENWRFIVLWSLLSFPNLLAYWVQHFNSIVF